jgi:hypothetical protein
MKLRCALVFLLLGAVRAGDDDADDDYYHGDPETFTCLKACDDDDAHCIHECVADCFEEGDDPGTFFFAMHGEELTEGSATYWCS